MKIRFSWYQKGRFLEHRETNYPYIPRVNEQVSFDIFDPNNEDYGKGTVTEVYYTKDMIYIDIEPIDES